MLCCYPAYPGRQGALRLVPADTIMSPSTSSVAGSSAEISGSSATSSRRSASCASPLAGGGTMGGHLCAVTREQVVQFHIVGLPPSFVLSPRTNRCGLYIFEMISTSQVTSYSKTHTFYSTFFFCSSFPLPFVAKWMPFYIIFCHQSHCFLP